VILWVHLETAADRENLHLIVATIKNNLERKPFHQQGSKLKKF